MIDANNTISGLSEGYILNCLEELKGCGKVAIFGANNTDELLEYVEDQLGREVGFELKQHHVVLFEYA
jgi:hypothetical protein